MRGLKNAHDDVAKYRDFYSKFEDADESEYASRKAECPLSALHNELRHESLLNTQALSFVFDTTNVHCGLSAVHQQWQLHDPAMCTNILDMNVASANTAALASTLGMPHNYCPGAVVLHSICFPSSTSSVPSAPALVETASCLAG